MTATLQDFWAALVGTVHPLDQPVFDGLPGHGFNLDHPPPAFVGDVVNAPVLILENNGGFDPVRTAAEFRDAGSHEDYRAALRSAAPLNPKGRSVSPYYLQRNYSEWLISGQAALVNGVAYRSINGAASKVAMAAKRLPSALFHQHWLRTEVLAQANRGERFIIVHRWARWNDATAIFQTHPNAVFSPAPISKDLTAPELQAAKAFLRKSD